MKEYIVDYPLHILEVRRFKDYEKFQTDLKWVFGFLQRDQNDDELSQYINENKNVFSNMAEDAFELIAEFSHSWKLLETYKNNVIMCKAIDDMMAKSEKKGIIRGIIRTCQELGVSKEIAFQKIMKEVDFSKEKADEYITAYWA